MAVYSLLACRSPCSCSREVDAWRALREQTLRFDLEDSRWDDVAKPFFAEGGRLPTFVELRDTGALQE